MRTRSVAFVLSAMALAVGCGQVTQPQSATPSLDFQTLPLDQQNLSQPLPIRAVAVGDGFEITGTVYRPTPCTTIAAQLATPTPRRIDVHLLLDDGGQACIAMAAEVPFKARVTGLPPAGYVVTVRSQIVYPDHRPTPTDTLWSGALAVW